MGGWVVEGEGEGGGGLKGSVPPAFVIYGSGMVSEIGIGEMSPFLVEVLLVIMGFVSHAITDDMMHSLPFLNWYSVTLSVRGGGCTLGCSDPFYRL